MNRCFAGSRCGATFEGDVDIRGICERTSESDYRDPAQAEALTPERGNNTKRLPIKESKRMEQIS
ncbi:hypothetical protein CHS0354_033884 [Potamilus streckersoni]|uniref:Uncharacterized protein n=1 Tax=Potamilus streckersoni TaxID=2493646 RepID=A0AAE0RXE7_9BIVA|nr:hypothetical protein CHS0354_033884 [Potamilus streckersoni]